MEDVFHWCRAGHSLLVRAWLEEPEHDLEQGDEHGFSPLHWSAFGGRTPIAEMLIVRGARVAARNAGDDTPLHLAAAHGHRDVASLLLRNHAPVDAPNAHGNTPLHYACFWGHQAIAEDLIQHGALVSVSNAYGETPLDKAKGQLAQKLLELAVQLGQDTKPVRYKDLQGAFNTRPRDGKLSRHSCIELKELAFDARLAVKPSGESWHGTWQKNGIVAKLLSVRDVNSRVVGAFLDEFPRLRIFGNPNVLPLLGCCCQPPTLVLVSQYMRHGSLFQMLHSSQGVVVDAVQALRFALDVARGMAFLHSLDSFVPRMHLSSKHIMVDADLTARVNMADAKFSFQEKGKIYDPAWMAPEALQKTEEDRNVRASDMWSFAILLWELATRQVPFASLSPMQTGMQIALEGLRVEVPAGAPPHLARLIGICMNEDPGKRPSFDMILPILEKMNAQE